MKKILYIMQGIAGIGKSTIAELIEQMCIEQGMATVICSTDKFWYLEDPNTYNFDRTKLGVAHKWNQEQARLAMQSDGNVAVIIDNTNLTQKEANPYIKMGKEFGFDIRIISVGGALSLAIDANYNRSEDRRVPTDVVLSMYKRQVKLVVEE